MSKPARHSDPKNISAGSRTFFVTSSTWQKQPLFKSERMANLFIEVIFHYQKEGHFQLHEFTAMPDHFHVLLTLTDKVSVERAVQLIKGGFSFRVKKDFSSNMEIWQRGFSEYRVSNEVQYNISKRYIWNNAVK